MKIPRQKRKFAQLTTLERHQPYSLGSKTVDEPLWRTAKNVCNGKVTPEMNIRSGKVTPAMDICSTISVPGTDSNKISDTSSASKAPALQIIDKDYPVILPTSLPQQGGQDTQVDAALHSMELSQHQMQESKPTSPFTYNIMHLHETKQLDKEVLAYLVETEDLIRKPMEKKNLVAMYIDLELGFLTVYGGIQKHIDTTVRELEYLLENEVATRSIAKSEIFIQCFKSLDYNDLMKTLSKYNVQVGWAIRDGQLCACSQTSDNLDTGYRLVEEIVTNMRFKVSQPASLSQKMLIKTDTWKIFIKDFEVQYPEVQLTFEEVSERVVISLPVSQENSLSQVFADLQKFYRKNNAFSFVNTICLSEIMYRLLEKKQHNIFTSYINTCYLNYQFPVKICLQANRTIMIKSDYQAVVEQATNHVFQLLNSIKHKTLHATKPCLINWLKSVANLKKVKDIDMLSRTVSTIFTPTTPQLTTPSNPAVRGHHDQTLGWLFEHWPFLHQYQSVINKLKIVKGNIAKTKVRMCQMHLC